MKKCIALLMLMMMSIPATAFEYGEQRVIYHISGGDERQNQIAMRNIQNHINAVGVDKIQVKVVMHGPGVDLMMRATENPDLKASIDNLRLQDVQFLVCYNTLVSRNIDHKTRMYGVDERDIIPSGVAHLSYLQAKGFTYIKP